MKLQLIFWITLLKQNNSVFRNDIYRRFLIIVSNHLNSILSYF